MKNKISLILISSLVFTFLFYHEYIGINLSVFALLLVSLIVFLQREIVSTIMGRLIISGTILSSISIFLYGNTLSISAMWFSLAFLSIVALRPHVSSGLALLHSHLTLIGSPIFILIDLFSTSSFKTHELINKSVKKILKFILPIIVIAIFIGLYAASNAGFNHFLLELNIKIDITLIIMLILGFFISYAFFRPQIIDVFEEFDKHSLSLEHEKESVRLFNFLGIKWQLNEIIRSGIVLFLLLNFLILFVNSIDVYYLFILKSIPDGMSYSDFIHQGVGQLIFSILFAIVIILFYFRGEISYSPKNKWLKTMIFIWIVQNIVMVLANLLKNDLYITEYSLTYKRIGVYFYLSLTIIGLVTTWIKISRHKSNYFLYYINTWIFYFVLASSSLINWDQIIVNHTRNQSKTIDKNYLFSLSNSILPDIIEIMNEEKQKPTTPIHDNNQYSSRSFDSYEDYTYYENNLDQLLTDKICSFISNYENNKTYKSFIYSDYQTYHQLKQKEKNGEIKRLVFEYRSNINVLPFFENTTSLSIQYCKIYDLDNIKSESTLKNLELIDCGLSSLNGIDRFKTLESLDLRLNPIVDYSPLKKLPHLKKLTVSGKNYDELFKLKLDFPELLIINI